MTTYYILLQRNPADARVIYFSITLGLGINILIESSDEKFTIRWLPQLSFFL